MINLNGEDTPSDIKYVSNKMYKNYLLEFLSEFWTALLKLFGVDGFIRYRS